jgi:phosphate transport system substrate-binding protein
MQLSLRWLSLGLLTAAIIGCGSGGKTINGAGSTFVEPMMQEWASIYDKEKGIHVNYQGKGSSSGIGEMTEKRIDFGCSDAPFNDEQLATAKKNGGDVVHIPLCMGAIVPAYNLPGDLDIVFSGDTLIDIYVGKITDWNDEALKKLNPKIADRLPSKKISVAYRSEGSGSTYILTDYFTKVNKTAWTPGRGTAIKFPVGTGSKGTDGVAGYVKATEGAIGYIELIYALKNDIKFGAVVNGAGKTIKADLKSVTAAAATAEIPDDLRYSITNAPGDEAYPIAGTVWAIVYVKQPADKMQPVVDFLRWATHVGQKHCEKLHYAALPEGLVKKIDEKLKMVEAAK